ncbi:MAG: flavin reductase family protein [Beutenbergiaceae bacterium]
MDVDLRQVMSRSVSGVVVIAARDGNHDVASTITSFLSVSLDPPMVGFLVHRDARLREAVEQDSGWAVSILGEQGRAAATWLGEPGRPILDQLAPIPHRYGPATGAAILDAVTGWVEARTASIAEYGSHDFVVGEVLEVGIGSTSGAILHGYGQLHLWNP